MTERLPFCANPDCVLHVTDDDPAVAGSGEWAVRPDGIVTSRGVYDGRVLCDLCGRNATVIRRAVKSAD